MPRLFDDLKIVRVSYATCMWCHNLVSNPDSVWERQDDDSWKITGHVGTTGAHDSCRESIAEAFKVKAAAGGRGYRCQTLTT